MVIEFLSSDQFDNADVDEVQFFSAKNTNQLMVSVLQECRGDDWTAGSKFVGVDVVDEE